MCILDRVKICKSKGSQLNGPEYLTLILNQTAILSLERLSHLCQSMYKVSLSLDKGMSEFPLNLHPSLKVEGQINKRKHKVSA